MTAQRLDRALLERAADLVGQRTGCRSPESHHSHLHRILLRLSRENRQSPEELLTEIPRQETLYQRFINQAMIGETYFFREETQFKVLLTKILPSLAQRPPEEGEKETILRLWSASCSTGEEPLSLAAAARSVLPPDLAWEVYASDINRDSLEHLRRGIYRPSSFRQDGSSYHHLMETTPAEDGTLKVAAPLLDRITVLPLNLYQDSLEEIPPGIDVIFFRNTLIYAPPGIRRTMIARLAAKLRPGGCLFTAASEAPFIEDPLLILQEEGGVHYYRRRRSEEKETSRRDVSASRPRRGVPLRRISEVQAPAPPVPGESTLPPLLEELREASQNRDARGGLQILGQLESLLTHPGEYLLLTGWFYRSLGERPSARQAFRQAAASAANGWPAPFFLGELTLKESPWESREALKRCLHLMEENWPCRLTAPILSFVCEGFAVDYFKHLCRGWLQQLEKGGSHGA